MQTSKNRIEYYREIFYKYRYVFMFSLIITTFFFSIYRIQCGLYDVIMGMVTDKLGLTNITDEIFEGIFGLLSKGCSSLLDWLIRAMTVSFEPTESMFTKYLSPAGISMFRSASSYIAGALAVLILFSALLSIIMSGINGSEVRDDPVHLLIRFVIAIIVIYYSHGIMQFFLDYANDIWQNGILTSIGKDFTNGGLQKTSQLQGSDFALISGTGTTSKLLGVQISSDTKLFARQFKWFWILVSLIMLIPLIKNFIRLYVEIVERYIVVMLLVLFFGVAIATCISRNTENILRSYLRMFGCQMFLMLVNAVFMKGFVLMLKSGLVVGSLVGYVFAIAYLRSAQRLDSYMASMGLNVAQTGASLLDAMGGGFKAVTGAFKSANNARKSSGELVSGIGLATGNMSMIAVGKTMGAGIRDIGSIGKTGIGNSGINSSLNALQTAGENGVAVRAGTVAPSVVSSALDGYLFNTSNRDSQNVIKGMNQKDLLAGLNSISDGKMKFTNVDTSNLNKGIVVKGETQNGAAFTGILSNSEGTDIGDDTGILINTKNSSIPHEAVTLDDIGPDATATDLAMHFGVENVLPDNVDDMNIYSAQIYDNGNVGLFDDENVAVGTVADGQYIPNPMYDKEKEYEQLAEDFAKETNGSVPFERYQNIPDLLSKDNIQKYTGGELIGDRPSKTEDAGIQTFKVRTDQPDSKGNKESLTHDYQLINLGAHPEVSPKGSDRVVNVKYGDLGSGRVLIRETKLKQSEINDQPPESFNAYREKKNNTTKKNKKNDEK